MHGYLALSILAGLVAGGCAAMDAPVARESGAAAAVAEVRVCRASQAPIVDGVANDAAWAGAEEVEVPLEGTAGPPSCRVRAAVHGGTLYLVVRWRDPTEDRTHKPWTMGAAGAWQEDTGREDAIAVAFPMDGEFTASMLSPLEATWDVWHWKAARTDPVGKAMDRVHRMTFTDPGGDRHEARLPDGRVLYIARPEDEGDSATDSLPPPIAGADSPQPRYRARRPTGSAADVAARGRWEDGEWTVELARALATEHDDDRDLADLETVPFALAVLDRAEDGDHAASGVLTLVFPAEPVW